MVLRLPEVPPRPAEYDGALCLFDLDAAADEAAVRAALRGFGTITFQPRSEATHRRQAPWFNDSVWHDWTYHSFRTTRLHQYFKNDS